MCMYCTFSNSNGIFYSRDDFNSIRTIIELLYCVVNCHHGIYP